MPLESEFVEKSPKLRGRSGQDGEATAALWSPKYQNPSPMFGNWSWVLPYQVKTRHRVDSKVLGVREKKTCSPDILYTVQRFTKWRHRLSRGAEVCRRQDSGATRFKVPNNLDLRFNFQSLNFQLRSKKIKYFS